MIYAQRMCQKHDFVLEMRTLNADGKIYMTHVHYMMTHDTWCTCEIESEIDHLVC